MSDKPLTLKDLGLEESTAPGEIIVLRRRLESQELATLQMQIERDEAVLSAFRAQLDFIKNEAPRVETVLMAAKTLLEKKRKEFREKWEKDKASK